MPSMSRRDLLGSLALTGVGSMAAVTGVRAEDVRRVLSPGERKAACDALTAYFAGAGPKLFREAGGYLQHPSISPSLPGKAYSAQLWDWDTYWTARGLLELAKRTGDGGLRSKICEHAKGSLRCFFEAQSDEGRIPIMLSAGKLDMFGSLTKGRPHSHNQAKPVMAQMALRVARELGDYAWFAPHFDGLLRFYASWDVDNLSHVGLYVWGNDVAIGNDNDPTTFGRPEFSSANVLLNCLFYADLKAAAEMAVALGRSADAAALKTKADALGAKIQELCWDPRDGFYYTVDVQCRDRRAELIPTVPPGMAMSWQSLPLRVEVFTGFLPMWCGLATQEQGSELVKKHYGSDDRFRANFGVRTLSSLETMYSLEAHSGNPSNWLGPVWIIANYFVWRGLREYGFAELARELADKTIALLAADLAKSGSLNEYYHPDTGAALSHAGFMDWNMLVLEMM